MEDKENKVRLFCQEAYGGQSEEQKNMVREYFIKKFLNDEITEKVFNKYKMLMDLCDFVDEDKENND